MARKAILVPCLGERSWCAAYFPSYTVASLPVVGRPFVEYQLDQLARDGVEEVLVLDYEYDVRLGRHLSGDGRRRWPFRLDYRGAGIFRDEQDVRLHHASFVAGDASDVRIVMGMKFPKDGSWTAVDSLSAFFALNFDLLGNPGETTLDGYSGEKGVRLGMNVILKTGHDLRAPLFLGDNVRLEYGVRVESGVIVGRGSVVDEGTCLAHTVVFPGTYVGRQMSFESKIVAGNRVIDPVSGAYVDLEETGLSGDVRLLRGTDWSRVGDWLLALALATVYSLPSLAAACLRGVLPHGEVWAYRFFRDRLGAFWKVLACRGPLVRRSDRDRVWALRASDAYPRATIEDGQLALDDAWFRHNRSFRLTFGLVAKAMVTRFFANEADWERANGR